MSAYTDGLETALRNGICDLSRAGVVGGLIFAGVTATTGAGILAGLAAAGISAHLYASLCNRPLPPEGRPRRPFTGGQCDGVRYRCAAGAFATDRRNGARYQVGSGGLVWGKIHQCELVIEPENFNRAICIVDGSQDDDIWVVASEGYTDNGVDPRYTYSDFYASCVREDGQPDLCGDPPFIPPPLPPPDYDVPTNIVYINNEGNTVNVPITLNLGLPRIDVNGTFNMPITIKFDVDPTLNIGGDVNFNTGDFTINVGPGKAPSGRGAGDPDNITRPPGEPPPTPPGVPDPPEPPDPTAPPEPALIIRACIVTVSQAETDASIIFQNENPDIYAPSLGHVSFLCEVAGAFAWTADIPVKNRQQLVICPWQYGAVDVKATPKGGATFDIEKIYDYLKPPEFP